MWSYLVINVFMDKFIREVCGEVRDMMVGVMRFCVQLICAAKDSKWFVMTKKLHKATRSLEIKVAVFVK